MKVLIALVIALPAYAAPKVEFEQAPAPVVADIKAQSKCSCKCVAGGSFNNLSPEKQMRMIQMIMEEAPKEQPTEIPRLD